MNVSSNHIIANISTSNRMYLLQKLYNVTYILNVVLNLYCNWSLRVMVLNGCQLRADHLMLHLYNNTSLIGDSLFPIFVSMNARSDLKLAKA